MLHNAGAQTDDRDHENKTPGRRGGDDDPARSLKMLGLEIGEQLTLEVDNGALVASPVRLEKKRFTLAELLDGAEEVAALNARERAWDTAPPVGKEAL